MRTVISVDRPFHSAMLANSIVKIGSSVEIFSSAPRWIYKGLNKSVSHHWVPAPLAGAAHVLKLGLPRRISWLDYAFFDLSVSVVMGYPDIYIGWPGGSLFAARHARKHGGVFVLDRACPHRDFQEKLIERESARLGVPYDPQPNWFRERQLEEYELAEAILVPSEYSFRSFPDHLRHKLVKAPLLGRCAEPKAMRHERNAEFTVGVVGGNPMRKGYLYLLRAWQKLALPNAKLLLRTGSFKRFPVLRDLLNGMTNVEFVNYVSDISEFYQRCDVFVLPSIDDGFGMALMEAMINGRACVATSNTGASELLTNGQNGIVVDAADEDQLAAAILRLFRDEELRTEMGVAAVARAKEIAASGIYDRAIRSLLQKVSPMDATPSPA